MIIELNRRRHSVSVQRSFPVFYHAELIGNLVPDLIVDDAVIVGSQSCLVLYRNARGSNDWISKRDTLGACASSKFQELTFGLEANCPSTRT